MLNEEESERSGGFVAPNQLSTHATEAKNARSWLNQESVETMIKTQSILIDKLNDLEEKLDEFKQRNNRQNEEEMEKLENLENGTNTGLDTITKEIAGIKV